MEWLKALLENATVTEGKLDIDALMKSIKEEFPKNAVPKSDFNTLNDTKKELEQQIKDRDNQLKNLGEKVKGNEDFEKTIKELQETNEKVKGEYEGRIKDMTINSAIQSKLTDTKYPDLLLGKFDKSKIAVNSDGTTTGIDEQLATIKESYKELFTPVLKGTQPNNNGTSQPPTGKRAELEAAINDPKTPFVQRIALKTQLANLEEE